MKVYQCLYCDKVYVTEKIAEDCCFGDVIEIDVLEKVDTSVRERKDVK